MIRFPWITLSCHLSSVLPIVLGSLLSLETFDQFLCHSLEVWLPLPFCIQAACQLGQISDICNPENFHLGPEKSAACSSVPRCLCTMRRIHSSEGSPQRGKKLMWLPPLHFLCTVNNLRNKFSSPQAIPTLSLVPRASLYTFPYCHGLFLAVNDIKYKSLHGLQTYLFHLSECC
jgi:hypothetical protein